MRRIWILELKQFPAPLARAKFAAIRLPMNFILEGSVQAQILPSGLKDSNCKVLFTKPPLTEYLLLY